MASLKNWSNLYRGREKSRALQNLSKSPPIVEDFKNFTVLCDWLRTIDNRLIRIELLLREQQNVEEPIASNPEEEL